MHRPFRGLLSVHSRYGPHTRAATYSWHALPEGFSHFVTSMTAPVAYGWSGCRVGFAPTGKRRLFTAHTRCGHWLCRFRRHKAVVRCSLGSERTTQSSSGSSSIRFAQGLSATSDERARAAHSRRMQRSISPWRSKPPNDAAIGGSAEQLDSSWTFVGTFAVEVPTLQLTRWSRRFHFISGWRWKADEGANCCLRQASGTVHVHGFKSTEVTAWAK